MHIHKNLIAASELDNRKYYFCHLIATELIKYAWWKWRSFGDPEQNEELYRFTLWIALLTDCILMHKVPLTSFFCPLITKPLCHRETIVHDTYIRRANHVDHGSYGYARALSSAKLKTHPRGSVLKMHWIRTIESFYLGQLLRRNGRNESVRRNG